MNVSTFRFNGQEEEIGTRDLLVPEVERRGVKHAKEFAIKCRDCGQKKMLSNPDYCPRCNEKTPTKIQVKTRGDKITKYKYKGEGKINLLGTQYNPGDTVDIEDIPEGLDMRKFEEVEVFVCEECEEEFDSKQGLSAHKRTHENKEE